MSTTQGLTGSQVTAVFRALADQLDAYVSCVARDGTVLFLSRGASREPGEVVGKHIRDFVAPEHRANFLSTLEDAFVSEQPRSVEFDALMSDGKRQWFRTKMSPLMTEARQWQVVMTTTDDTERHQLSQELEQSLEFKKLVVENLPDFVVLLDDEHRYVWVNHLAPGLKASDVIGQPMDRFISPESLLPTKEAIDTALRSRSVQHLESRAYKDENTVGWYHTRVVPVVRDPEVTHTLLVVSDITERKEAEASAKRSEEQLRVAQRLETVGLLAGGIAHDFNNLLQVISANLHFARQLSSKGASIEEELEQALNATARAADLTSQLLAVGKRKQFDQKLVDVDDQVSRCVRMLRRAIPANIEIRYLPPKEGCFAFLDATQFDQVLLNLCVNARDAMPDGGVLTVSVEQDETQPHIVIGVSDTGLGVPAEHVSRIFEPFFSTKGMGSGLGLAVALGIVSAHGGELTVESEEGHGSRFLVRIPRTTQQATSGAEEPTQPVGGTETILLAEDEPLVRALAHRVLSGAGYQVLEAADGKDAIEVAQRHAGPLNLVLLDVMMPRLDGWQTYLELERLRPGIPVVFATGYAASTLPPDYESGKARVLSKPFSPNMLLAIVREALDEQK